MRAGVSADTGGYGLASCSSNGTRPRLLSAGYVAAVGEEPSARALAGAVRDFGLTGLRCHWLMAQDQYQIVQVDAPDVPEDERVEAGRWRIRDLVRIPLDQAVIDGFLVPDERGRGGPGKLYMVASRRGDTDSATALARTAGVRPDIIGIPELALRNLAALHPEQRGGVAMLAVSAGDGLLTISRGETLFLCRWLDTGADGFGGEALETMALEVQRSLDFYESQLSGSPASRVVVVPRGIADAAGLAARLDSLLGLPVEALDLGALLDPAEPLTAEQEANCALAVGAALEPSP